jgi:outer membrane protein TolC
LAESRTDSILRLLEARDSVAWLRAADDLLPSARLYGGLGWNDAGSGAAENTRVFLGIDFGLALGRSKEKARAKVARIDLEQRKLGSGGLRTALRADLGELAERLAAQRRAVELARERRALSESILEAENREYSFGRTDINDLIQALNTLQESRFAAISQAIRLDALRVEWLRLTDRLVTKKDLERTPIPQLD